MRPPGQDASAFGLLDGVEDTCLQCLGGLQEFRAEGAEIGSGEFRQRLVIDAEVFLQNSPLVAECLARADFCQQVAGAVLGLDDAETMLEFDRRAREKEFIATPSYTQVIEPINTKGMGRWLRYREYLEPVLPILAPMLGHWGYTTEARTDATEH